MTTSDTDERAKVYVERFTRMFEEIAALQSDVADISDEAKGAGFDVAALKKVAKLSIKDAEKVAKERAHLFNIVAYAKSVQLDLDFLGGVGLAQSVKSLRDTLRKDGASMTISTPGMEPVTVS